MSFKFLLKAILVIMLAATTAAWLKMAVPRLSIGYFPLWQNESLRNIVGIFISMALYEFYYLGYMYLLAFSVFALAARRWQLIKRHKGLSPALGAVVAAGSYALYKMTFYLRNTQSYEAHGGTGKSWFDWIEYPADWQLLLIYTLAGAAGGWLYWWLLLRRQATPMVVEQVVF